MRFSERERRTILPIMLFSILIVIALVLVSCALQQPGEREVFGEQAIVGEAIGACKQSIVTSCTENVDGSLSVAKTIQRGTRTYTRTYAFTDACQTLGGKTRAINYRCAGPTTTELCTALCQQGEVCQAGSCIVPCTPSEEICDAKDNDCDQFIDEGCDDDNDDYCDAGMTAIEQNSLSPEWQEYQNKCASEPQWCCLDGSQDCDDGNPQLHPYKKESCDGIDNDCDQLTDENFNFLTDKNHCGECQIACDIGMFCVSGSCALCTQEGYSTTVTLTGTQKISEVKPELTATDLPLLLRDGQVTNEKGTVSYMQRLLFSNPASGFVDYTENDVDVTAYFLRMPYNIPSKEMVRYVLQFQQPFESDIIGGLGGQILEDYIGTSIEILGNTYTITNAVRDSSTGISLILVNGGTTIILPDENIFYIPPFFRYILNGEPIDGTAGSIEGYIFDNENRLTIDAIVMTMNAEDDYFVGAGSTLSKEIEDAGEDPEVLFTQNWDLRFKEYNTATNSRTIEIGRLCPIDPPICIDYDDGVENEALVASGAFGLNPQTNQVEFLSDYCIALTSSGGVYSAFERQCSPDGSIYGEVIPCPGEIPCGCG